MKYIKIIIPVMLLTVNIFSQNTVTGLSWSMGFLTGTPKDYIGKASFTGFTIEGHRFLKPNVSVGLVSGWNVFNEKTNSVVNVNNTAISGEQGRYINVVPILASFSYYIKSSRSAKVVPFFRANVGTYYIMQRFDIGVYTFNNYNWHFGVAPELGLTAAASRNVSILVNGKYNYAFDSGLRLSGDEKNDYAFFTVNLGITYAP
jgi:hypothetical protein